jgi:hypothetical protein
VELRDHLAQVELEVWETIPDGLLDIQGLFREYHATQLS